MRGTIHVLTPDDALALRPWVQPALDQQSSSNQMSRPARDVPADELVAACRRLLADGPLPVKRLGERLAEVFPDVPAGALAHKARERAPLVQVPPRGLWKQSGGVVYQTVENHLGRPMTEIDVPRAGPSLPARVRAGHRRGHDHLVAGDPARPGVRRRCATSWWPSSARTAGRGTTCRVRRTPTGTRPHRCGCSAATTTSGSRTPTATTSSPTTCAAAGPAANGGVGNTVFVDGFMAGLWWDRDGRVELRAVPRPDPRRARPTSTPRSPAPRPCSPR